MMAKAMVEYAEPRGCATLSLAAYLVVVSLVATAVAAAAGFVFIAAISFPLSVFAALFPSQMLNWLWNGAILAAPVTLVLLPASVIIGRRHPVMLYFALPLVGLIGGIVAIKLWPQIGSLWPQLSGPARDYLLFDLPSKSSGHPLMIATGGLAGMFAGAFFSAAVREMRR